MRRGSLDSAKGGDFFTGSVKKRRDPEGPAALQPARGGFGYFATLASSMMTG